MFDILALFPGVPLFFIISGFLITDSYLNSNSTRSYFVKRGLRVYPALFINILILEFAMYIGGHMSGNNISLFEYIVYFFTYVVTASGGLGTNLLGINYGNIYNSTAFFHNYPSGVLWTLTVELSFYLVLPLIFYFKNVIRRNSILVVLFFIALLLSFQGSREFYALNSLTKLLYISVFPYLWIFIMGMVMRLYWIQLKKYFVGYGLYYLVLYILYCSLFIYFFEGIGNYKSELYISTVIQTLLLSFVIFSMAFSYTNIKFNRKIDLSYSIYLYHMLFVQILIGFDITGSVSLYFVVYGTTLVVAYLSWTYIEKPMLRLKTNI